MLRGNRITDAGANALLQSIQKRYQALGRLDLADNHVTDVFVKQLRDALANPTFQLKNINLDDNRRLTDAGLEEMSTVLRANVFLEALRLPKQVCRFA